MRWRRIVAAGLAVAWASAVTLTGAARAMATDCPTARVGGPAVGWVTVGDARVPLKPIRFASGESLELPGSSKVAGLSRVHATPGASLGTSVIAWHVRYGRGCPGSLNVLLSAPVGTTFDVQLRHGEPVTYRIVGRSSVPRGRYPVQWFDQVGEHRVVLLSCADLWNGAFRRTVATFAVLDKQSALEPSR